MAVYPDLKVFIVDDDIFCLTLYNQFLKNLGYSNVTSFTGGLECLDHLNAGPELIFLDYNMEGMNGIEVLNRIKEVNPNIAVYIITGKEDPKVAAEAVKQGAVDYVVKSSLSPDKMKAIMEHVETLQADKPREVKKSKGFFAKVFRS
jgi:DNA-binding NtrC family response regulator